ncbi:MAG: hypothetical protein WD768_12885 [Phycisphaeraceae bacterium]
MTQEKKTIESGAAVPVAAPVKRPAKAAPKPPPPPTFFGTFLQGLTRPSLPAVIGTLCVALAWLAACVLFLTPANLARIDARYLMTVEDDDYTEVSLRAFRIAAQPVKPAFAIALFGTSGTREAISDEKVIEEAVSAELGTQAPCYFLAAKALSPYEMVGVMDHISEGFEGIVVMHIGPNFLSDSGEGRRHLIDLHRLAFQNEVYDEELRAAGLNPPSHTGNYFLDNWRFFSVRTNDQLLHHLIAGPPVFKRHRYVDKPPLRENQRGWDDMVATAIKWMDEQAYRANRQTNRELLDRMIARLRRNGRVELVLVEVPRNPVLSNILIPPALASDHRAFMQQWAQQPGVHYFELDQEAALTADDLEDYIHLRSPAAQERYTKALAQKLRQVAAQWKEEP